MAVLRMAAIVWVWPPGSPSARFSGANVRRLILDGKRQDAVCATNNVLAVLIPVYAGCEKTFHAFISFVGSVA